MHSNRLRLRLPRIRLLLVLLSFCLRVVMLLNKHVGDCSSLCFFRIRLFHRLRIAICTRQVASNRCISIIWLRFTLWHRTSQNRIKIINHRLKFSTMLVSRARQINLHVCNQMPRMRSQNHHAICHLHSFFNIVRNDYNRLDITLFTRPKLKNFLTKIFCCKNVKRRKWLVHKQSIWAQNQCARNTYALTHAARKLLWVRCFEAVQTNSINCS
ncbi:Uncharacterised protein [Chlamydia trachomatis]|nr:Uncharacterised protein [Chlamydia trachomatis]